MPQGGVPIVETIVRIGRIKLETHSVKDKNEKKCLNFLQKRKITMGDMNLMFIAN